MTKTLDRPVVLGAGPIGRAVVAALHDHGARPVVVTRSLAGAHEIHTDVEHRRADVSTPDGAREALHDASVVFQCAQPPYHRWVHDFRPFQEAILVGCAGAGAPLVAVENLYGYGPVTAPMTESTPLITAESPGATRKGTVRAEAWRDLERAHASGRVACSAVRASDFVGPGVVQSVAGERFLRPLLADKPAEVLGPLDVLHSLTAPIDVGRAMVAVAADESTWGRAWHAPTAPARAFADVVEIAAAAAADHGASGVVRSRRVPSILLRLVGLANRDAGEVVEMLYQFDRDFVLDSSRTERRLGLTPTPLERSIEDAVAWFAGRSAAGRTEAVSP